MSKKITVITGGAGFIGSHLCDRLIEEGLKVICLDNLITGKLENIKHLLKNKNFRFAKHNVTKYIDIKGRVDYVLHFASPASPEDYLKFPIQTLKVGSLGTHNALGLAKEKKAKFMLASTSVSGETSILLKERGRISLTLIGSLSRKILNKKEIEVLTMDENFNVTFKPIQNFTSHQVSEAYKIKFTGGDITLTGSHSVYIFKKGKVSMVDAKDLLPGDHLVTFEGNINLGKNIPRLSDLLIESGYPGDRWEKYNAAKRLFNKGLSYKEIANRLGIHYHTIYEWIKTDRKVRTKGEFSGLLTKDSVRFFGYYLAEGCSEVNPKRRMYRLTLTFGSHESQKAQDAVRILKKFKLNISYIKEKSKISVVVCNMKLAYFMKHFFGEKAHVKNIPYFVWGLPKEYVYELLKGYICDARITSSGQIVFSTVSKNLALQLVWLLKLNDIGGRYSERRVSEHLSPEKNIIKGGIVYDISISKIENPFRKLYPKVKFARSVYAKCIPTTLLRKILRQAKISKKDRDSKYYSRCYKDTINKTGCAKALEWILRKSRTEYNREDMKYLKRLISSSIGVAKITQVKRIKRKVIVYDISVPGVECFFGGKSPILLHNSEVYGDPLLHPQPETYWGNVNPLGLRGCYDEAKRFAEAITMAYHRVHKMDTKIIRIFNTYGPFMRLNDGRVVPNFIYQALNNKPLTVYGRGTQTRSFCYISDLIEGIYKAMSSRLNEPINLGNPDEFTILELAKLIVELTDTKAKIVFRALPEDDPKQRKPDIAKAKKNLNWQPKIELKEGLKKTIAWFRGG